MGEIGFPKPVSEIVATLTELFRHQNGSEFVELLESAHAHFEQTDYDNWNGGTYTWALRLEVPVPVFASIEPRLESIEQDIGKKLGLLSRPHPNHDLGEVTVSPIPLGASAIGQRMAPSDVEVRRLWTPGRFRLFLSHVSKHKAMASELKDALEDRGISAFVAHEDIQPSLEWQGEISLALKSMHALVALITADFHGSDWTDQEVGWALGRGVLVLPIRLEADPYGFAGKVQAVPGSLNKPILLAHSILKALLSNSQTHGEMRRALVGAFATADCWATARILKDVILKVDDFTDEEMSRLRKACDDNDQVGGARGVRQAILNAFGVPQPPSTERVGDDIPF